MVNYIEQEELCRMIVIQEYFDEKAFTSCGHCDICLEKRKSNQAHLLTDYRNQIISLISEKPMTSDELERAISPNSPTLLTEALRQVIDEQKVYYDKLWVLRLKEV